MKTSVILATVVSAILIAQQAVPAQDPNIPPDVAAAQARTDEEDTIVGRAIGTRDFALLDRFWSPLLVVNSQANIIESRSQVIDSMRHGGLNYTSLKGTTEFFTVTNGVAIEMMHEDVVMANGPMAGKHLVRRSTNILQPSGDDWVLIARQATDVGIDGGAVYGHPDPTLNR